MPARLTKKQFKSLLNTERQTVKINASFAGPSGKGQNYVGQNKSCEILSFKLPIHVKPKARPRVFLSRASLHKNIIGNDNTFIGPDGVFSAASSSLRSMTPETTKKTERLIRGVLGLEMRRLNRNPLQNPLAIFLDILLVGKPDKAPTRRRDGDLDNLEKLVLDAMNGIVFEDDRLVVFKVSRKSYSHESMLHILVFEVSAGINILNLHEMADQIHSITGTQSSLIDA